LIWHKDASNQKNEEIYYRGRAIGLGSAELSASALAALAAYASSTLFTRFQMKPGEYLKLFNAK
jgi:hypothetical protein